MRKATWLIALSALIWVVVGIYGVIFNISYIDEAKYLIKGWLMTTGQVSYYKTPEFFYQHMPGVFLWYGLGQKIFGPSLLVGRLQSFLVGLIVYYSSFVLGKRLAGYKGGVVTLLLLSLSSVAALDYSAAVPQSLVVLTLIIGFVCLYDGLVKGNEPRFFWASFWFSLAFIVRENFLFTLILYAGLLVFVFRDKFKLFLKHLTVILMTLGVFIIPGYPGTVAVLKNFPGVSRFLPISQAEKQVLALYWKEGLQTPGLHFRAVREFGVIFHAWAVIWFLIIFDWLRKPKKTPARFTPRQLFWWFLVGATVFNFIIHSWAAFKLSPRAIISYFSYVSPLVAVIMAGIITPKLKNLKFERLALGVYLGLLALVPVGPRFARIFAIPTRNPDLVKIVNSASKLEPLIEGKENIVWIDEPISLYLAERVSYYPLIHHTGFYKSSNDTEIVRNLGFWNQTMLNGWLKEADLVVVGANKLKLLKEVPEGRSLASFIEAKLNEDFELIEERVDIWPGKMVFYEPKTLELE
ncbi:hypothetical protein A3J22_01490 [Candidatus Beckwithbacteria bacterium RIFCSPLOWO2_02_FULL_49_12]|nr:MAG: hypothetical protein A3J22_01490 [Candidatus Beckwithbacteria bacterium RIFCSPLOWO2_02_FULL_49_12]